MQADLLTALDAFCDAPVGELDQTCLQERAVAARALAGRLLGVVDQTLGELAARCQGQVVANPGSEAPPLYRSVQGWWRDAAVLTGAQAGRDLRRAAVLRDLPRLAQAVTDGELAPEQVAVLSRLHGPLPTDALVASQAHLVEVAAPHHTDAIGRLVAHLIATHCEPALDHDHATAHGKRYLQLHDSHDGTVRGRFRLTSEDAEALRTVLEPLARRAGTDDPRSAGQRRADALVEVFAGAAAWMDLPHAGGQRAHLSYVVTADWCAGVRPLDLPASLASAGLHPAALARYAPEGAWTGPQTRARIETVLCDARISRLLLDPHGTVISLESLTDAITPAQRRAVSTRDRHCVAKGCTRPPAFCDVHHLHHRADGGITSVENLVLLCRRHHVLWHRGTLTHHDLHLPWLQPVDDQARSHDPWDEHNPPLLA